MQNFVQSKLIHKYEYCSNLFSHYKINTIYFVYIARSYEQKVYFTPVLSPLSFVDLLRQCIYENSLVSKCLAWHFYQTFSRASIISKYWKLIKTVFLFYDIV